MRLEPAALKAAVRKSAEMSEMSLALLGLAPGSPLQITTLDGAVLDFEDDAAATHWMIGEVIKAYLKRLAAAGATFQFTAAMVVASDLQDDLVDEWRAARTARLEMPASWSHGKLREQAQSIEDRYRRAEDCLFRGMRQ